MPHPPRFEPNRPRPFPGPFRLLALLVFPLAGIATIAAAAPVATWQAIGVGDQPMSIAAADFNGDGRIDLATANRSGSVSFLFNDGLDGFQPGTDLRVGGQPISLAAGDLDHDGNVDLVMADESGPSFLILHGTGTGSFIRGSEIPLEWTPNSIALADMDRDGHLDAVVSSLTGWIGMAKGRGDGSFMATADQETPEVQAFGIADLDGDGALDVAMAGACRVTSLLGDGAGGFAASTYASVGCATALAVADFDRDGIPDVVTDDSDELVILKGRGDGSLMRAGAVSFPQARCIGIADLNRDGFADILATRYGVAGFAVLIGDGRGKFLPASFIEARAIGALLALDLDEDGFEDVVSSEGLNGSMISVFTGHGDGTFGDRNRLVADGQTRLIVSGDVDRDGHTDLVTVQSTGHLVTWRGDGTGRFSQVATRAVAALLVSEMRMTEVTGDGIPDLLVLGSIGFDVFPGIGNGAFGEPVRWAPDFRGSRFTVADLNHDGLNDVAMIDGNAIYMFRNLGGGEGFGGVVTRLTPYPANSYPAPNCSAIEAADLNEDGYADLIVTEGGSYPPVVMLGSFYQWSPTPVHEGPVDPWIALGDFDHDGHRDLALGTEGMFVHVKLGDGTGAFSRTGGAFAYPVTSIASATCGTTDLFVANQRAVGSFEYRTDVGPAMFAPRVNLGAGSKLSRVAIGDFDEDGCWDAACAIADQPGIAFLNSSSQLRHPIRDLHAEPVPHGVEITWQWTDPARWTGAEIQFAEPGGAQWTSVAAQPKPNGTGMIALDHRLPAGHVPWYRLIASDADGSPVVMGLTRTIGEGISTSSIGALYPNPTTGPTRIQFALARRSPVRVTVSDLAGRVIAVPVDGTYPAGQHEIQWDGNASGKPAPAGVYFVRLQADDQSWTRRVAFVR